MIIRNLLVSKLKLTPTLSKKLRTQAFHRGLVAVAERVLDLLPLHRLTLDEVQGLSFFVQPDVLVKSVPLIESL